MDLTQNVGFSDTAQVSILSENFMEAIQAAKQQTLQGPDVTHRSGDANPLRLEICIDCTTDPDETDKPSRILQKEFQDLRNRSTELQPALFRLTYFNGRNNIKSTKWTDNLQGLMDWADSRPHEKGNTQYAWAFYNAFNEANRLKKSTSAKPLLYHVICIGLHMEEAQRTLYGYANALAKKGISISFYHNKANPIIPNPNCSTQEEEDIKFALAAETFREIARITNGQYRAPDGQDGSLLLPLFAPVNTEGSLRQTPERNDGRLLRQPFSSLFRKKI